MPLPELFDRWTRALIGAPLPEEPRSDCANCPMIQGQGAQVRFSAETRCCTYEPHLYNFQLGGVLSDRAAPAHGRVRDRLRSGIGVTPLGLSRSGAAQRRYREMNRGQGFGRDPSMRCPWYSPTAEGTCGIWRHRNAACSTWFCKHERGECGEGLWSAALHLLGSLERAAAARIAAELGASADSWGPWEGRIEAYLLACWERAEDLDPSTLIDGMGETGRATQALSARALAAHEARTPPTQVRFRGVRVLQRTADGVLAATHSPHQTLALGRALLQALPAFNHRPRAEVQAAYGISDSLLIELVDFKILEPVG